jgi:hypothetical protein
MVFLAILDNYDLKDQYYGFYSKTAKTTRTTNVRKKKLGQQDNKKIPPLPRE